jgi:hypothetical protein
MFKSIPEQLWTLRKVIEVYRGKEWSREIAIRIIRARCPQKNQVCQALAIADAVQRRTYYVKERPERFQFPKRTWKLKAGDCDDFTTLIGSLCESIGIPIEVWGLKVDHLWRHVYPVALIQAGHRMLRLPLDATMRAPVWERRNPIQVAIERGHTVETLVIPAD